jgi:hypothetical protein
VAASLFVNLAAELLKWQTPATAFSEAVSFLTMGMHEKFANLPHNSSLADQHAVTVTVKAVARFHGMAVRRENIFTSGEDADQRKQRGAWQMKICQQRVHHAKVKPRNNKQACFGRTCEQEFFIFRAARRAEGAVFESPNYRCANGQDGASSSARRADPCDRFLGNLIGFAMHDVAFKRFTVDGLKCAEPNV